MLVLKKTEEFKRDVLIHQPGGKDGTIKALFEKIPQSEREEIVESDGVYGLLNRVVKKVFDVEIDGISDEEEIRQIVLNDTPCSTALLKKYVDEVDGLGRKNSKRRR